MFITTFLTTLPRFLKQLMDETFTQNLLFLRKIHTILKRSDGQMKQIDKKIFEFLTSICKKGILCNFFNLNERKIQLKKTIKEIKVKKKVKIRSYSNFLDIQIRRIYKTFFYFFFHKQDSRIILLDKRRVVCLGTCW